MPGLLLSAVYSVVDHRLFTGFFAFPPTFSLVHGNILGFYGSSGLLIDLCCLSETPHKPHAKEIWHAYAKLPVLYKPVIFVIQIDMPTLKVARGKSGAIKANFGAVWSIVNENNIIHEGQGLYSYVGGGGTDHVGLIKTNNPLDPDRNGGISSFEITLRDTGK